jgi:hypothetical protein
MRKVFAGELSRSKVEVVSIVFRMSSSSAVEPWCGSYCFSAICAR